MPEMSARTKDKVPIHQSIYEQFRDRIESGELKVGDFLPTEDQLCAEQNVSRYALREALNRLEKEGIIRRRRRAGTQVIAQTPKSAYRHMMGSRDDLLSFVKDTTVDFAKPRLIETDGNLARLLGCDELRRWTLLEGTRIDSTTGRPIGITQVYIDASRVSVPVKTNIGHRPVYEWLEENHDIRVSGVSQDITAVQLTPEEAEIFGERPGSPSLRVMRRYFDDQQRIYMIAVITHCSEDFVYNLRFQFEP